MRYGVQIDLHYMTDSSDDLASEVEAVVDHLIDLEACTPGLLDSTVGLDMGARTLEVQITIEADTGGAALDQAVACLRSAIHTAGGSTPGWENDVEDVGRIAYVIDDEPGLTVRRLLEFVDA